MCQHSTVIDRICPVPAQLLFNLINQPIRHQILHIHHCIICPGTFSELMLHNLTFRILDPSSYQRSSHPQALIKAVPRSAHHRFCFRLLNTPDRKLLTGNNDCPVITIQHQSRITTHHCQYHFIKGRFFPQICHVNLAVKKCRPDVCFHIHPIPQL